MPGSRRGSGLLLPLTPGFKDTVAAAQANRQARQPELVTPREELAALKWAWKQAAHNHAATVRELEETIRVYANQIQFLAMRNAELEDQARRLRRRLAGTDPDVVPLPDRS